jgi:hypothetical protein
MFSVRIAKRRNQNSGNTGKPLPLYCMDIPVPFETMVNIQNMTPTVKSYRVHHLER